MPRLAPAIPVGVVGAGTMGAGIAQVAVLGGHPVRIFDVAENAADNAVRQITARIERLVEKRLLTPEDAEDARARLSAVRQIKDLADSGLVIEAAAEDLAVKKQVFAALEEACAGDAVLATNTSTFSVTAVAAGLRHPERVCGMHFFNPAPLMKLVEVPAGAQTSPEVADLIAETANAWGKTAVRCASTPGFVVNRVARPFYGEAMRLLEEGAADCATIDAVLREAGGFPMGPFELADLVGNDINLAVGLSVWEQTFGDPRYAPAVAQQGVVDAGALGRKTGKGWFAYGGAANPLPATAEKRPVPERVVYHGGFTVGYGLLDRISEAGVSVERYDTGPAGRRSSADGNSNGGVDTFDRDAPDELAYGIELPSGGLVIETTGEPATVDGDAVVLDWVFDAKAATRVCLAAGDSCEPETLDEAIGLFQAAGLDVSVIDDAPGLVVARTVAMLVNEAVELVSRGEALAADVDTAMVLGTGYPLGLLQWGDRLGPATVADLLAALAKAYPSGRYRPAPLLVRAAHTGRLLAEL